MTRMRKTAKAGKPASAAKATKRKIGAAPAKRKAAPASSKRRKTSAEDAPAKAKKVGAGKKAAKGGYQLKTVATERPVGDFIASVPDPLRRADAERALAIMNDVTGLAPLMWGPSIIGYGRYRYKYASGHEGEMCRTGFSPRASSLVFYLLGGVSQDDPLFARLGKHKMGKSCVYIPRLSDIDEGALRALVRQSLAYMERTYPE